MLELAMKLLVKILVVILFLFSFAVNNAEAKSYFFDSVIIDAYVQNDSSIKVIEKRRFNFDGSYTKVYWDIPLKTGQDISNVTVSESYPEIMEYQEINVPDESRPIYKYAVDRNGNAMHIEAYHSSFNESREFTLTYTFENIITRYDDVAELYWQAIGRGWDAKTDSVTVNVHLPEAAKSTDELKVWAHGPLNGVVNILNTSTIQATAVNLPQKEMVELRVLFPSSMIVTGPQKSGSALGRIEREEKGFQDKTVMVQRIKTLAFSAIPILLIAWVVFWYVMWFRDGREYKFHVPKYVHAPPSDLAPALVEALITQGGSATANSFTATILDLARRGYIKIEAREELRRGFLGIGAGIHYKYILHKGRGRTTRNKPLADFETRVLDFVFSFSLDEKTVEVDELKKGMRKHPTVSRNFFLDFQKLLKVANAKMGFIEVGSTRARTRFVVSNVIILIIIGILVIVSLGTPSALVVVGEAIIFVVIFGGLFFAFLGNIYLRWTKAASKEAAEWLAFKRYLNDFSKFKSEIPQAVVIWEKMLVYGTVLGVAKKVSEYLPLILKDNNIGNPGWYYYTAVSGSSSTATTGKGLDFATGFTQSMASMSTSFSTSFSSGSGGGFSGGGGGGSGGGGGGAS